MKTASECLEMLAAAYHCPDVAMTETIEVIQLDAFKAGMTRAAEVANDSDGYIHHFGDIKKSVELARDSLKPGDVK